ncbi:MAG: polysaccharide biosynthesis tyrosine autokinase [Phycisphaerales bacterium]|nr:polysaccharide biosynthesis tyrosine autokinase [Phycisphaerales bacterium]
MTRFPKHDEGPEEYSAGDVAPMQTEAPRPGLLQIVWRYRWMVLIAVVLCMAGGFVYLVKATPIFGSTGRLYVEQSGPKIMTNEEGVFSQSKNYLYTQVELVTSTPILAAVAERPEIRRLKTLKDATNAVGFLKANVSASVGKKDDILSVSCESPHSAEAAQIVNAVVDEYITYHSQKKSTTSAEVLKILQAESTKRTAQLDDQLKEMLEFRRKNDEIAFDAEGGNTVLQRMFKLSDALTDVQIELVNAKAAHAAAKKMMSDPARIRQLVEMERSQGIFVSAYSEEDRLRTELREAQVSLAALLKRCTAEHDAVKAVKQQIDRLAKGLKGKEQQYADAYLSLLVQRKISAESRQQELQRELTAQKKIAADMNIQTAEFAIMKSALGRTERLCDIIDSRIKELNVTENTGAMNITILEVAVAGGSAIKPQKTRVMAMVMVMGLMLGVGLALLRDWTDQRLRSSEEVAACVGAPVLGVVPSMKGKHETAESARLVADDPTSHIAEAYRTIRTGVFFGVPDGEAKTILVTSPTAGDGKTTMACNLSIAMAQAGQRVLLIDCDFRKPRVHKVFKMDGEVGMSNVLAGRSELSDAIQLNGVQNLSVLPCGPTPPNPSEMLNSQAFLDVLEKIKDEYDHIIIDSPPVMPVTDSRILAAVCDQTILVIRAEKSTRKAAEHASEGLRSVGARILGVVVNAVAARKGGYGYGYGYGYGSGYGYGYGQYGDNKSQKKGNSAAKSA